MCMRRAKCQNRQNSAIEELDIELRHPFLLAVGHWLHSKLWHYFRRDKGHHRFRMQEPLKKWHNPNTWISHFVYVKAYKAGGSLTVLRSVYGTCGVGTGWNELKKLELRTPELWHI